MTGITKVFMRGLVILVPIVTASYVLFWLITDSEAWIKGLLKGVTPQGYHETFDAYYVPGLGLALLITVTFLAGLLMYPWLSRKILEGADYLMRRIPLYGSIYSPIRDLMEMLGGNMSEQLGQVVLIKLPNTEVETLGFIVREDMRDLPPGMDRPDYVTVFVQWSSQIGGYCFIVPRSSLTPVDMSREDGLRWSLTAGISAPRKRGSWGTENLGLDRAPPPPSGEQPKEDRSQAASDTTQNPQKPEKPAPREASRQGDRE